MSVHNQQSFECKIGFDHLAPAEVRRLTEFYEKLIEARASVPGPVGFEGMPSADAFARVAAEIAPAFAPDGTQTFAPAGTGGDTVFAPPPPPPATPTPPAPPPPPAPPAAPKAPPVAGELDVDGVPYNADLHSGRDGPTRGKNQAGQWKMKKGANRDSYRAWADSHKGTAVRTPVPPPAPTPPAPPPAPDMNAQYGAPPVSQAQAAPPPPPPPAAYEHVTQAPGPNGGFGGGAFGITPDVGLPDRDKLPPVDFTTWVALVSKLSQAGKLPLTVTTQIKQLIGCHDEVQINRDDKIRAHAYYYMQRVEQGLPL